MGRDPFIFARSITKKPNLIAVKTVRKTQSNDPIFIFFFVHLKTATMADLHPPHISSVAIFIVLR
jgi:hypothetical protein